MDQHARLLRVGAAQDGEDALRHFVASERHRVDDLLQNALRDSRADADKLEGIMIVVRPSESPHGPCFRPSQLTHPRSRAQLHSTTPVAQLSRPG